MRLELQYVQMRLKFPLRLLRKDGAAVLLTLVLYRPEQTNVRPMYKKYFPHKRREL